MDMECMVNILQFYRRRPESVCAYGILLYGPADIYIRQILDDNSYCDALDALSGPRWTIFFARMPVLSDGKYVDGEIYNSRLEQEAAIAKWLNHPPESERQQQQMQQMQGQRYPTLLQDFDSVLERLGLTDRLTATPQLLVVIPIDDDDAYVRASYIKSTTKDEAYQSLRDIVESITRVFEAIAPENLKNAEGVVAAFDLAKHQARFFKGAKVALKILWHVKKFFG